MEKNQGTFHNDDVVIIDAVRTPWGAFMGSLSSMTAPQLGAAAIKALLERNRNDKVDITKAVDLVLMGNVVQAGEGQNPARQAALGAGLPGTIEAVTLNMVCGSGLKAVMDAATNIRGGYAEVIIAGGMESMSNIPYYLAKARTGYRLDHGKLLDGLITDGLWDAYNDFHMGMTGELVAEKYKISREEQDKYAVNSHQKAVKAQEEGKFKREIVPVSIARKKQDPLIVDTDESPRKDSSVEKLGKLSPVFKKDGTVTAGNASSINDGASALLITSYKKAKEYGWKPLAKINGYASAGVEPKWVMIAPINAIQNVMKKTGTTIADFDLVELNEPFAVAAIAVTRELGMNLEKVNVSGSGISLGHPIGATGARLVTSLVHALHDRKAKLGLASLCLGGGNAVAMVIERV